MEVNQLWKKRGATVPDNSRLTYIPPMLWSRFYHSLSPLLELRMGAGGYLVYCWSHRHLKESAEEHYLTPEVVAHERYGKLAEYFGGCNIAKEQKCNNTVKSEG